MAYISKYSGMDLDNTVEVNEIQNNRLSDLENNISTVQSNITNIQTDITNIQSDINLKAYKSELLNLIYPIGSIYENISNTNPGTFLGGTWSLIRKIYLDTEWQNYTWTNTTYMGTTQSSYTQNKWKVKDNILYVHCGMGATSTINTSDEVELARIPITKGWTSGISTSIWTGAVGGSGAVSGFYLIQDTSYISVKAKPHTSSNNHAAPWYSAFFCDSFK